MRKGTILVVTAMDERTVVLRARAGRYRLGAWSDGHQRHPTVGVGSRLIAVLTSARQGPTMVRPNPCECTAALYALKAP
jgi:hypothetical protein